MMEKLAIDGATPVRKEPMPPRALIGEEEKAAVVAMFDEEIRTGNAYGYGGPYEEQYEKDFAAFMGGGYADGVNSGTNAVYCALGALQLDALSEVICPPITDCGGAMPVALLGCVPVPADADPRSYNTNAEQIEVVITPRTRAVIVAHIAGEPVDMDPVLALARKHNLYVIEDCAQAHGARYKGKLVGTLGDVAAFSTMFGKHHCTGGQGGVVYTPDEDLYWRAKRFADRGKPFNTNAAGNVVAGLNCNLTDLAAAIGSVQLRKLPAIIAGRRKVGEAVKQALAGHPLVSVGWQAPGTECVYWFLRVKLELEQLRVDKDRFCEALIAEGLPITPEYRAIPYENPWFKDQAVFGKSRFPWSAPDYEGPRHPNSRLDNAINVAAAHFNIAVHENCGQQETDDIVAALKKVAAAYAV